MMELKINKTSELSFKLNIEGSTLPPKARLVFKMDDNAELIINGKVENQKVKVEIPPLKDLKEKFNSNIVHSYLEVIIDENYFQPWEGEFNFKQPLVVTAESEISDEKNSIEEKDEKNKVTIEVEDFKEKEEPIEEKPKKKKKEKEPEPKKIDPEPEPEPEKELIKEDDFGLVPDELIEETNPDTFVNSTMSADEYIKRRLGKKK